jgi:hypothetical protein
MRMLHVGDKQEKSLKKVMRCDVEGGLMWLRRFSAQRASPWTQSDLADAMTFARLTSVHSLRLHSCMQRR